jgi:hypothetical protein
VTPGYVPDYASLLGKDPGYMGAQNNAGLANSNAAALRDAAIRSLQYGYNGAGNQFSDLAQLQRQFAQDRFLGEKSLAGRGALHSSEVPYLDKNLEYTRDLGGYNAGRSLEQQVYGALANYLGTTQSSAQSVAAAAGDAYGRLSQNPLYQPSNVQGHASLVPDWQSRYGQPVYTDGSGGLWVIGADGNPTPYAQGGGAGFGGGL